MLVEGFEKISDQHFFAMKLIHQPDELVWVLVPDLRMSNKPQTSVSPNLAHNEQGYDKARKEAKEMIQLIPKANPDWRQLDP